MPKTKKLIIYTDGGARGNPGPAGIGVVVYDDQEKVLKKHREYVGERTNNEAEYMAVIKALELAKGLNAQKVKLYLDSELIVRQLNSRYKVKQPHLQKLFMKVRNLETFFGYVSFSHVRREKNQLADRLVNNAVDDALATE